MTGKLGPMFPPDLGYYISTFEMKIRTMAEKYGCSPYDPFTLVFEDVENALLIYLPDKTLRELDKMDVVKRRFMNVYSSRFNWTVEIVVRAGRFCLQVRAPKEEWNEIPNAFNGVAILKAGQAELVKK